MSAPSLARERPVATRKPHYVHRILQALQRNSGRTVLHSRYGAITAGRLHESIVDASAGLHRAGAGAGTIVALLTEPNHPVLLVARYAAHLLGATVVHVRSMNPRSDAEAFPLSTQAEILRTVGARILVVDHAHVSRGRSLADEVAGMSVVTDLSRGAATTPAFAPYVPENLAVIEFTSGSTSLPKMVRQPFGTREALVDRLAASAGPPVTLLSVTPISHTTAPMADAALSGGGAVVLHNGFGAGEVLHAVAAHRVTDVYLAVPHLYRLLDHPGIADADLSSLRRVVYSGTPAAPARIAAAVEIFGDRLVQVYGTTETGGITSLTPLDHREPELLGTAGRPFPWVSLEIREPAAGAEVARGQTGEVWVRSPTTMAGYLDAEPAEGGWVRTGDLGRWDRHGYLQLVGRTGDVVKSGGMKLYPAAIEQVLLGHPQVRDAVAYGVRDDDYVEHLHAAVELRDTGRCTVAELRKHVADALPATHVPEEISIWDRLPLGESGKPDRHLLRTRKGTP